MAPPKGTSKRQEQRMKETVILTDFDKKAKIKRTEIQRAGNNLIKQVESFYTQAIAKIPKAIRDMPLKAYLEMGDHSVGAALSKIEVDVNNAIQLPDVGKPRATEPRAAPKKIQATISLKSAMLEITDSPVTNDDKEGKVPRLDVSDLKEVEKIQQKLSKIVAFNKRNENTNQQLLAASSSKAKKP